MIKCFHGTANYNINSFIENGIILKSREWSKYKTFCASLSFQEATFFALRKTPISDLSQTGVVLEFEGDLIEGIDFIMNRDPRALRDEKEIAVFDSKKLLLIAYWEFIKNGRWQRKRLLRRKNVLEL